MISDPGDKDRDSPWNVGDFQSTDTADTPRKFYQAVNNIGFACLTAATVKSTIFWVVAPCGSVEVRRRFGGTSVELYRTTRRYK
jgi:hypothetical protein